MILFNPTKNPAKNPAKNRNDGTWMAFGWWKDWQESGRNCPGGKPHFSSRWDSLSKDSKMPQSQDSLNQDSGVSGFRIARLQAVSANSLTETGKELERIVETRIGILVLGFSGVFQGCFKLCFQRSYRWLISRDSWGFLRMSHGDFFSFGVSGFFSWGSLAFGYVSLFLKRDWIGIFMDLKGFVGFIVGAVFFFLLLLFSSSFFFFLCLILSWILFLFRIL